MSQRKAVLFSFWGVVAAARPGVVFRKFEESHQLPRGFLFNVVSPESSAVSGAERGDMTLTQMIPVFEAECAKAAQDQGVTLPEDWSVRTLLEEIRDRTDIRSAVLQTADALHRNGLLTAVLANQWIDDTAAGDGWARLLSLLGSHFDLVQQSCRSGHRVPEAAMFTSALQRLGVTPQQALWLAEDEEGVEAAKAVGMKSILVEDVDDALNQLADFTGVQAVTVSSFPPSCIPDAMPHGYVTIRPGMRTHYVEMGSGPPVLLCHGFPESWYSWRYQIPALAEAGFRVLALDMKGYGESTAPSDIEEYSQEQLCQDLIAFMDKMMIPQVTLCGHDWGGSLVWSMAQCFPERVKAVASLNTPLFPVDPSVSPMMKLKAIPIFDYQIYFQNPGVAEAELEQDLERTLKVFFSSSEETVSRPVIRTTGVCARGGLLVGLPEEIPLSSILTEASLQYYVSQFKASGLRGPLNWYRNVERNWKWMCSRPRGKLMMPALMVTTGKDPVLLPVFSKGMEEMIPNLTRGHIEECGHWTLMEKPAEVNKILIRWLQDTHNNKAAVPINPKL
ncbi:bifunctional epoxide hydrolase 2 [Lampris incognitus]|uniref:bifunctional epoxide hydrolase 2 n=1 Tax=Lampris incognitus TaxID=2546036 RepID=UPI0024B57D6F|nr:bifunctional epoxide hydrolase 2 [Lampris incognitus]